jgi:uridine kinase
VTPDAAAALVVQHALSRPPTIGAGRLVCIDGPAGSGKTTLADTVARRTAAQVVHMDDLYGGWDGLFQVAGQVQRLLRPLAHGLPGPWQRYDWHVGRFAEWHQVRPGGLLVLEGVGSGSTPWAALTTTLVYVEAARSVRLRRGLDRDGDEQAEHWRRFMVQEELLLSRERTRARADLVVRTP